jgi:hypothetical protein
MSETKNEEEVQAEDEKKTGGWRAQLPDDLKENEAFTGFEKLGDLGKEYLDLKGRAENSVQIPDEDADEEEWAEFYKRAGRPESAEQYGLTRPDNLPEDVPYNDFMEQSFRDMALRLNLTDSQARGLYDWYNGNVCEAHGIMQKEREREYGDAENTLKQELGQKYGESLELAKRAVRTFGGEEMVSVLEESRLGNHPAVFKTFLKMALAVKDDQLVSGSPETEGKTDMLDKIYPKMKK